VAKKIVTRLRFSSSWSPLFAGDLDKIFVAMPRMWGYQACVHKMADAIHREHAKHNLLKTRFYISCFPCYSGMNTQGSQEFIANFEFRQFDMVQLWNDCTQSPLSQPANFAALPVHSDAWTQMILLC